jgi:hypothetical protein
MQQRLIPTNAACPNSMLNELNGDVFITDIEGDFLTRLFLEPWTSPPVFDHGLSVWGEKIT